MRKRGYVMLPPLLTYGNFCFKIDYITYFYRIFVLGLVAVVWCLYKAIR
jgi:hypothetical protein